MRKADGRDGPGTWLKILTKNQVSTNGSELARVLSGWAEDTGITSSDQYWLSLTSVRAVAGSVQRRSTDAGYFRCERPEVGRRVL